MLPITRPPFGPTGTAAATIEPPREKGERAKGTGLLLNPHPFSLPLDFDKALAHEVTLAADLDGGDAVAVPLDSDFDEARSAHLDPLLADDPGGRITR